MGIIQLYDRKRYGSLVTRIIFKKSIENYILPKDYKSFDICCIGGGASGEAPYGSSDDPTSLSWNGYTWVHQYRGYTYGSPGGPGGHVITKKQINIEPGTPITVKVGKGGSVNYRSDTSNFDVHRNDLIYLEERAIVSKVQQFRYNGLYQIFWSVSCTLRSVCNMNGNGEDSFVKNIKTNEILCEAKGGSLSIRNSNVTSGFGTLDYVNHISAPSGPTGSDRSSNYWYYGYGGGNPGGNYYFGYYKGKTKGNYSFNLSPSYYATPYEILRINNSRAASIVSTIRNTSTRVNIFNYDNCSPDYVELLFNKKDGQNLFGLGLTHIMGDEREKGVAGGGSSVPYFGLFIDEPQGKRTDDTDEWKGEDGGGNAPVIKKLVPAGTILDNANQIEIISPATPGKPNTGGGGGGGFAINMGAHGLSTYFYIRIPPAPGGSGCVYIDCYEKDYRPQTRVVGRTIVVE